MTDDKRIYAVEKILLFSAGIESLKVTQRSFSDQSNISAARCADCGNCSLNAITGGQIFLTARGSNCPPPPAPRIWVIDSGRGDHVVQLTVLRRSVASVPETEIEKMVELKVRDGVDPANNLLLLWTSRDDNTDADWSTATVLSTGNLMSVTWSVTSERTIDMDHRVLPLSATFIAKYKSIGSYFCYGLTEVTSRTTRHMALRVYTQWPYNTC